LVVLATHQVVPEVAHTAKLEAKTTRREGAPEKTSPKRKLTTMAKDLQNVGKFHGAETEALDFAALLACGRPDA